MYNGDMGERGERGFAGGEDPYVAKPGERVEPHFYWDEGKGEMMVRHYVERNGESRLLPGEPQAATTQQIAAFYKNKRKAEVTEFSKPVKPSEDTEHLKAA